MPKVLVVDDEPSVCRSVEKILAREGYDVRAAPSGQAALALLDEEPFDVVFTDLRMAGTGGMELLAALHERHADVITVVITGYATVASVVETMKLGAFDYLPKPFTPDELAAVARKAWEKRQTQARAPGHDGAATAQLAGLIGSSPAMQEVYRLVRKVAPTSSTVLIVGETGTGKELAAKAIHALSPRREQRFFAVDCGTLSTGLLESELFGHVKGSFTGAMADKRGIFEVAHRGTVFLDEICNVDVEVQGKLLRFVQEREFLPVGATDRRHVDVRLVFATNRDLEAMMRQGAFREDLYYRLCVYPIVLPPLRDRRGDIPLLACHLLGRVRERTNHTVRAVSPAALKLLEQYDWPGNVRQLEGVIERAVIACDGEAIEARHLPRGIAGASSTVDQSVPRTNAEFVALKKVLREQAVNDLERDFVVDALQRSGWNVTRAAADVGILRPNFQALMRKHRIRAAEESNAARV